MMVICLLFREAVLGERGVLLPVCQSSFLIEQFAHLASACLRTNTLPVSFSP
jgi:hypothetical protein